MLEERLVDLGIVAGVFGIGFHVGDHADNLCPVELCAAEIEADLFSERILIVQEPVNEFLIDDGDARSLGIIHGSEGAAAQDRDCGGVEKFRSDLGIDRGELLIGGRSD